MRPSGRAPDQMRAITIEPHFTRHAEGSVLIGFGDTKVLVTASVEDRLPPWLRGKGQGWVTAEYGMLPRATHTRGNREAARGKQSGRTQEIQRLIGRSLRAVTNLPLPWARSRSRVDCDVIQADGGTRTAAITGAWVALHLECFAWMRKRRSMISVDPLTRARRRDQSCGIVQGYAAVLDLDYAEDSERRRPTPTSCITGSESGNIVEVQAHRRGQATFDEEAELLRTPTAGQGSACADIVAAPGKQAIA